MIVSKRRRALILALVALAPIASMAADTSPSNINDPYGVLQAMQSGDSDRLRALAADGNAGQRAMASAALYRSLGDAARSSSESTQCVRQAREASSNDIVLICGLIDAGNDLSNGRPGKWAYKVAFLRQQLYPAYRKTQGPDFSIAPLEYVARPEDFKRLPDAAYTLMDGVAEMPLKRFNKGPLTPMPTGIANGVELQAGANRFQAVFDTGSFMTLLNTATAKALGLQVKPNWMPSSAGSATRLGIGTVPSLALGPLKAKDVSVAISASPVLNIVGMDLIQQLGAVRIRRHGIDVLADADAVKACQVPMRVASALAPTGGRILVPINVDGNAEQAFLDTGSDEFLTRYGGPQPAVAEDLGKGRHEVTMSVGGGVVRSERRAVDARVDIGTGPHTHSVRVEQGPADAPFYVLGLPAVTEGDVVLDFRHHHACILKSAQ